MTLELDHLVIAARSLDAGVAWCDANLGIRPEAGGQHAFMGTHNRVFAITSATFRRAYFEIIAIDPSLPAPRRARWFDLDDAALQDSLARGPQLVHWVARCPDIAATHAALLASGIDCGELVRAERATLGETLRWQISLRADGRRPLGGAVPALIEWGGAHPTDAMPDRGVALESMRVAGWPDALASMLPAGIERDPAAHAAPLSVVLAGRRGMVTLNSTRMEG